MHIFIFHRHSEQDMPTGRKNMKRQKRRKFLHGRQSGGGNANAVNFTSPEAHCYLQGFTFNWITKQFKPHLVLNCFFLHFIIGKCNSCMVRCSPNSSLVRRIALQCSDTRVWPMLLPLVTIPTGTVCDPCSEVSSPLTLTMCWCQGIRDKKASGRATAEITFSCYLFH